MNRILDRKELEEIQAVNRRYYVYFITTVEPKGPIKIGFAVNPEKRLKTIQCSSPYALKMLGYFKGTVEDEERLHKHFDRYRMHGEWFQSGILSEVKEIIQWGGFLDD